MMWNRTLISGAGVALFVLVAVSAVVVLLGSRPKATATSAMQVEQQVAVQPTNMPQQALSPTPTPPSGPPAPGFDGGGTWINSPPLKLEGLRGKVVLVNFWTYGCYNCQNTLPYVKQWWDKYKDKGLVIVGVHSPEFSYEAKLEHVQDAVKKEGIGWPVVQDNEHAIWRAYHNNYWPRFYLIDQHGNIIYDHIGEGAYDEMDRRIAEAIQ